MAFQLMFWVVCAIVTVGNSITATNNTHFIGLFTFTSVETATSCPCRALTNNLVLISCVCLIFVLFTLSFYLLLLFTI